MEPNDEELMKSYQMGDSQAFEILYRRNSAKVFAYIKKRVQRRELAEECFQMVFTKFHNSRHHYKPTYSVEQWLYVMTKSTLVDRFRKHLREVEVDDNVAVEEISPKEGSGSNHDDAIQSQLEKLPPQQRQVIELRALDELSYREIAERLGQSESNMRQVFSRVIRKLKSALKPERGRL